eukprot:364687-Chlamydomonas_euryale.AAC.1
MPRPPSQHRSIGYNPLPGAMPLPGCGKPHAQERLGVVQCGAKGRPCCLPTWGGGPFSPDPPRYARTTTRCAVRSKGKAVLLAYWEGWASSPKMQCGAKGRPCCLPTWGVGLISQAARLSLLLLLCHALSRSLTVFRQKPRLEAHATADHAAANIADVAVQSSPPFSPWRMRPRLVRLTRSPHRSTWPHTVTSSTCSASSAGSRTLNARWRSTGSAEPSRSSASTGTHISVSDRSDGSRVEEAACSPRLCGPRSLHRRPSGSVTAKVSASSPGDAVASDASSAPRTQKRVVISRRCACACCVPSRCEATVRSFMAVALLWDSSSR